MVSFIVVVSKHLRDKKSGRSFPASDVHTLLIQMFWLFFLVWRNLEGFEIQEVTKNWIYNFGFARKLEFRWLVVSAGKGMFVCSV